MPLVGPYSWTFRAVDGGVCVVRDMSVDLYKIVEGIVKDCGLELFDLEIPTSGRGTLRVYITSPKSVVKDGNERPAGVQHQDCVSVSRKILDLPNIEELLPGDVVVEVSSPGINRKLAKPEHFRGALGERVKIKLQEPLNNEHTLYGKLLSFENNEIKLQQEQAIAGLPQEVQVPLSNVQRARVDFQFE